MWDAPYVSANDPGALVYPGYGPLSRADPSLVDACSLDARLLDLTVVDSRTIQNDRSQETAALVIYSGNSGDETVADPRFRALVDQRAACIVGKGYKTETTDDFHGVALDPSWTSEQVLAARVAEATCSDQMSYMQQAADIRAGYEIQIIKEHQAELVEIKRIADERVAKATQILKDAGVL